MSSLNIAEQERVKTLYSSLKERRGVLSPLNEAGFGRFVRLGYPGRKAEMFTYVNTGKLGFPDYGEAGKGRPDEEIIKGFIYSGFEKSLVVFTDGVYNENLSDVSALPLKITRGCCAGGADAEREINGLFSNSIEDESDPFAALNAAFQQETVILDLGKEPEKVNHMQILFHSSGGDDGAYAALSPRIFIRVPEETEVEIALRFTGSSEKYFTNGFQDILLGASSTLHYLVDQSDILKAPLFVKNRIFMEGGAKCLFTQALAGSRLTRFHNEIVLAGPEAVFEGRSTSTIAGEEEAHTYTTVSHRARDCKSNQYFNNIVLGEGRVSVDTTVEVQKGGGGAESGQLVKNTLLSAGARADCKPNLKIFADDVKCQHGATTGCLDEKQIFYMQSRGVSKRAAENAIISGLVESMLTDIRDPDVRKSVRDKLVKKIEE